MLITLAGVALLVFYAAVIHPTEIETCPAVLRYFVAKQDAFKTLDSSKLTTVAAGGVLFSDDNFIQRRRTFNSGPLYFIVDMNECRLDLSVLPNENTVSLVVRTITNYYQNEPNITVSQPLSIDHLELFYVVTKLDNAWKIDDIITPQ